MTAPSRIWAKCSRRNTFTLPVAVMNTSPHGAASAAVITWNPSISASMKDGAIMANSGHFDAELDLKALRVMAEGHVRDVRPNVQEFDLGGKRLNLVAEGRLVNLGAAEGHPAAVMDMSFANQALAAEYVAQHHAELEPKVYVVPEAIDAEVARLKLAAMGITLDPMTAEQLAYVSSWQHGT